MDNIKISDILSGLAILISIIAFLISYNKSKYDTSYNNKIKFLSELQEIQTKISLLRNERERLYASIADARKFNNTKEQESRKIRLEVSKFQNPEEANRIIISLNDILKDSSDMTIKAEEITSESLDTVEEISLEFVKLAAIDAPSLKDFEEMHKIKISLDKYISNAKKQYNRYKDHENRFVNLINRLCEDLEQLES